MAGGLDKYLNWARWVKDTMAENPMTNAELVKSIAVGAIPAALVGAGIGAVTGKKEKRRKRALIGAALGAILGGGGGAAYGRLRKYLDGIPFSNKDFEGKKHGKGDTVYLGVAGSANGENNSWFADEMREKFPGDVYMARHVDDIEEIYSKLKSKGLNVKIVGHSSGGMSAAKLLNNHPEAEGYLIDPVSWLNRNIPTNSVVFTSDKSTRHGGRMENTVADVGGRWNYEGDNSVLFRGGHSNKIRDIIRDFVAKGVRPGDKMDKIPAYVTQVFGRKADKN